MQGAGFRVVPEFRPNEGTVSHLESLVLETLNPMPPNAESFYSNCHKVSLVLMPGKPAKEDISTDHPLSSFQLFGVCCN